jgi:hypothetical protein
MIGCTREIDKRKKTQREMERNGGMDMQFRAPAACESDLWSEDKEKNINTKYNLYDVLVNILYNIYIYIYISECNY